MNISGKPVVLSQTKALPQPLPVITAVLMVLALSLIAAQPVHAQGGGIELGREQLLPVHIVAMSLAAALMSVGGIIARYYKKKTKNWLKLHKTFQWSAAILGVLGIVGGFVMVEVSTGMHFRVGHAVVALVSLILIALAVIVAYGFLKGTKHKKETRIMHRWIGRLTIVSFLTTIVFGLFAAGVF